MEDCDGGDNQQILSWSAVTNNQHYTDINITRGAAMDQVNLMTYSVSEVQRGILCGLVLHVKTEQTRAGKKVYDEEEANLASAPGPGSGQV